MELRKSSEAAVKELRIPLKEVHCEHCERRINSGLSQMPGVLRAQASSKTNDVVIKLQGTRTDEQALKKKLIELGYEPRD